MNYGKGRVFYTALGHEVPAMQEARLRHHLRARRRVGRQRKRKATARASRWLSREPSGAPAARRSGHRGASLRPRILRAFHRPAGSGSDRHRPSRRILRAILRNETDVLVLYDLISEIGDQKRDNLQGLPGSGARPRGRAAPRHRRFRFVAVVERAGGGREISVAA
jgi:hypothetical protein